MHGFVNSPENEAALFYGGRAASTAEIGREVVGRHTRLRQGYGGQGMAAGLGRSPSCYEGLQPENYAGVVKKCQIIFRRDQEV